jgi:hypothetical protein
MTEDQFWSVIDQARKGGEASASPEELKQVLSPLSDAEVSDFGLLFYEKLCDLNSWRLWAAGYAIAGGMSDDSFHYFRSWILGKGKAVFETALRDPDDLGPFIDDPEVENELLEYVAVELSQERGHPDPRDRANRSPDFNPSGEPFEEDSVSTVVPKLAEQFG